MKWAAFAIVLFIARPVAADVDAAKRFVLTLTEPVREIDPPTPEQRTAVLAGLTTPFWYDGLEYGTLDAAAAKRCKKTIKRAGTIKAAAKLPGLVDCLPIAMFSGALDGDADWTAVDVKKLPRVFKKHRSKLARLAKDPTLTLVISHFIPAGPAEYWDLWIIKQDAGGTQKLAGMLVVNETE